MYFWPVNCQVLKLLILSQYFPPETGAPQNRLFQLAKKLHSLGVEITVLTAMPNYPEMKIFDGYRGKCFHYEILDGLPVYRCWIFSGKSKSIITRLVNYFSFVITSLFSGIFRTRKTDFILCESPPLFLGISAYLISLFKGSKLIFNVSDLWPESAEKLGLVTNRTLLTLATKLEEFLYRKSILITGQTQGIVNNISGRFPSKSVIWLKNGIDPVEFGKTKIKMDWRSTAGFKEQDFLFIYAGIMGYAQGLEIILHAANILRNHRDIHFILVGDGPLLNSLEELKRTLNLDNVHFYRNRPKREVLPMIESADAAIVPLRRLELFKGAIPSKIYETLAMGKPILLGVEGEAKELFIEEGKSGWAFVPEDSNDLSEIIKYLSKNREEMKIAGERGSDLVSKKFNLDTIIGDFMKKLESLNGN